MMNDEAARSAAQVACGARVDAAMDRTDRIGLYVSSERPSRCPFCGAAKVVPIAYGMPVVFDIESDESPISGGCVLRLDGPAWRCRACFTDIYRESSRGEPETLG